MKRLDKIRNSEIRRRLLVKEDLVQVGLVMRMKLSLFGHICRMENERKIKSVMLGSMDRRGKRGRPKRVWLDDIREWCQKDIQTLSRLANERVVWKEMVNWALDTYGQCAQGV